MYGLNQSLKINNIAFLALLLLHKTLIVKTSLLPNMWSQMFIYSYKFILVLEI